MALAGNSSATGPGLWANSAQVCSMAMENSDGLMAVNLMVNGRTTR